MGERSFRKDLSKETSTVQLTKGNKAGGKNLVKLKTNSKKNKKNKEEKEKKKKIREIIRRVRKKRRRRYRKRKSKISNASRGC